jgi:ferredoxin
MTMKRKVIQIVEERCDGCGQCVTSCAEGAIELRNGKARLVSETYCDGLGACLSECPQGAILIEERDAPDFDPSAVETRLRQLGRPQTTHPDPGGAAPHQGHSHPAANPSPLNLKPEPAPAHAAPFTCPSSALRQFAPRPASQPSAQSVDDGQPSALGHWPVQLMLVPPGAPFLRGAHLLVCADCVPFAVADFHRRFLTGKSVVVGCPKLDDLPHYFEKLKELVAVARPASLTVLRMEVPCCGGIAQALIQARDAVAPHLPIEIHTIGLQGSSRCQTLAGGAGSTRG